VTTLATLWHSGFFPELLAAMAINLWIATVALALGLAVGLPLVLLQLGNRVQQALAGALVGPMRAAPTFVVMFFLLNLIPPDFSLFGQPLALSPRAIVALSLLPYAAAYVADNGREAVLQLRRGATDSALLFLPNLMRAFFVLVMSSGAAAAIGVGEGVAVVLREAERWPTLAEKLVVFGSGVVCFGLVFQTGFALVRLVRGWLGLRARRRSERTRLPLGDSGTG
jgi:ABC-type arginine transport system permease subunit